ncbi:MAG: 3-methyl-2-oxobutanoate hydroxymethyltransferase [Gemmatimonadetes bacterium]|nr:3-methyl-2-oxobutanoate hydroxymethyltransferase [Gemmatimonadota bacterium]
MTRASWNGLSARKGVPPIVMVTAYDYPTARAAVRGGADVVLVGDSAAMVVLGRADTSTFPLEAAVLFTEAVARGAGTTPVVADLTAGSYEGSDAEAVRASQRLAEAGADAVKLEGAGPMCDRVRAVVASGVPVVGHLGLLPQTASATGGYVARARTADEALRLVADAEALVAAGIAMLVLEAVPSDVAAAVTKRVAVPVIGIGAGAACDGQVLVWHDLLGFGDARAARFVRRYAMLLETAADGIARFAGDVRSGAYPQVEHTYGMPAAERAAFLERLVPGEER